MFFFYLFFTLSNFSAQISFCENDGKTSNIVAVSVPNDYLNKISYFFFNSSYKFVFTSNQNTDYLITVAKCPENFHKIENFFNIFDENVIQENHANLKKTSAFKLFSSLMFILLIILFLIRMSVKVKSTRKLKSGPNIKIVKYTGVPKIKSSFTNFPCEGDSILMYNKLLVPFVNNKMISIEWIDRCTKGVNKWPYFEIKGQLITDDNNEPTPIIVTSRQMLDSYPNFEFNINNNHICAKPLPKISPLGIHSFHMAFFMNIINNLLKSLLIKSDKNIFDNFVQQFTSLFDVYAFGFFLNINDILITIALDCPNQELIPKIKKFVEEVEISPIGEINVIYSTFHEFRYEAAKVLYGNLVFTVALVRKTPLYVLRNTERFILRECAVFLPAVYLAYYGDYNANQIQRFDKVIVEFDDVAFSAGNEVIGSINGANGLYLSKLLDKSSKFETKDEEQRLGIDTFSIQKIRSNDLLLFQESNDQACSTLASEKRHRSQYSFHIFPNSNSPPSLIAFNRAELSSSFMSSDSSQYSSSSFEPIPSSKLQQETDSYLPSIPKFHPSSPQSHFHRKRTLQRRLSNQKLDNKYKNINVIKIERKEKYNGDANFTTYFGTSKPEAQHLSLFYDNMIFYDKNFKICASQDNNILSDLIIPDGDITKVVDETTFRFTKAGSIRFNTKDKGEKMFMYSHFNDLKGGCLIEVENPDLGVYLKVNSLLTVLIADSLTGEIVWSISNDMDIISLESIANKCHPSDRATLVESIEHTRNALPLQLTIDIRLSKYNHKESQFLYSENNQNDNSLYEYYRVSTSRKNSRFFILSLISIHELKRRLEAFKEFDDAITNAMRLAHISVWHFEDTNSPMRVYTMLPPTNVAVNMNWTTLKYNVLNEFSSDDIIEVFHRALENRQPFSIEAPVFFNDFQWVTLRGISNGIPGQLLGTATDITQTKMAEDAVKQEKERAEEANSSKMRFLANMSHEIRNPLNGMSGLLELLLKTPLTPEQNDLVECAKNSFLRLLELLNDILDLAKIEQGKMQMENVEFSPLEVLSTQLVSIYKLAEKKSLKVLIQSSPNLPLSVTGDPHFFTRIFTNLAFNAVKFTETGYILIQVFCYENEDDKLIINVIDTGIGIYPENQERIFEAFTQGDPSIRRPYGGIGVGLTLIKKMIEMMKGRIHLESKVGVGSKFTVEIPLAFVYVPFVPKTLKSKNHKILLMGTKENGFAYNSICPHCQFYGFELVTNYNLIDPTKDSLKACIIVFKQKIVDNELYKKANELKKFYPGCAFAAFFLVYMNDDEEILDENNYKFDVVFRRPFLFTKVPRFLKALLYNKFNQHNFNSDNKNVQPNDLSGIRVLAADDNKTNRLILSKILQKSKAAYKIVENGAEVIDELKTEEFDIVILDQNMPVMDGPTCAKEIRKSEAPYSRIPIIAMTGSTMKEDKELCLQSGMNMFLSKPISIKDTIQAIYNLTQNHF